MRDTRQAYADALLARGRLTVADDAVASAVDTLTIVVQINGKVRGRITVPADASIDIATAAVAAARIIASPPWCPSNQYADNRITTSQLTLCCRAPLGKGPLSREAIR
mgnify:CR=1 FL=1